MKKRFLLLLIPFLFITKVNAEVGNIVDYKFINAIPSNYNMKIDSWSAGEPYTYYGQYFTFDSAGVKFVKVSYCASGPIAITNIANTNGVVFYMGSYTGGLCNFYNSPYSGNTYQYYFAIKELVDAGSGRKSVLFNLSMKSNLSYSTSFYLLDISPADIIPKDLDIPDYSVELNNVSYRIGQVETSQQEIIQKQNAIYNEQKNTTNAVNDVNDSINNDDVDVEENGSFFSDFDTEDNGGISSIITAPLVAIQAMLNNQCTPLTATYKGKELSLPCGTSFWAGLGGIKTFLNVAIGGLLCYRIILKLFKLIEDFKDPKNDKVEVMNL